MKTPAGPLDDDLIRQALAGDEDAFAALMSRYQDYIFHLCWRVLGERSEAEDLTQDCFLKLHKQLDRWKPGSKLSNWLYTVALNDCRKRLRRRRLAAFLSLDARTHDDRPLLPEPAAQGAGPERLALAARLKQALGVAVGGLPQDMREAFVLRYELDQDIPTVAEALGRSQVATRVLLHRARQRLRESLRAAGHAGLTPPEDGDTDD